MKNIVIPWSDWWYIEGNKAWFCGGEINALFCVNMNTKQCDLVVRIPECELTTMRLCSYCVKYEHKVYCLFNKRNIVWCYNIIDEAWEKIEAENWLEEYINTIKQNNNRVKNKAGKYPLLWPEKKMLEKKYNITPDAVANNECILVQKKIYYNSGDRIYCIDIDNDSSRVYKIEGIKFELYTICYDGSNFWLGGYSKEIYVWNPEKGIVKKITEFPEQFGIYNYNADDIFAVDCNLFLTTKNHVFFQTSVALGRYVWYIPHCANEILYIDKETYKVSFLKIDEEKETDKSWNKRHMKHKYLLEYIREDRYIGLYSNKNQLVFEIDTVNLSVKKMEYTLSNEAISKLAGEFLKDDETFREKDKVHQAIFKIAMEMGSSQIGKGQPVAGTFIYHNTVAEEQ